MPLTIDLPPIPPGVDAENAALIALLQSWSKEDATDDPAEFAARQQDWEELSSNLTANRLSLPAPKVE